MDPYIKDILEIAGKETAKGAVAYALKGALAILKGNLSKSDERKADKFAATLVTANDADVRKYDPNRQRLERTVARKAMKKAPVKSTRPGAVRKSRGRSGKAASKKRIR
jgi:hypothetical protein